MDAPLLLTCCLLFLAIWRFAPGLRATQRWSAMILFLSATLMMMLALAIPTSTYFRTLSWQTDAFAAACVVAFCMGSLLAGRTQRHASGGLQTPSGPFATVRSADETALNQILAVATIVYVISCIPLVPDVLGSSVSDLRATHWQQFGQNERSIIDIVRGMSRLGAIIMFVVVVDNLARRQTRFVFFGLAAMFAIFIETTSFGGRFLFIFYLSAIIVSYMTIRSAHRMSRKVRFSAFAFVAAAAYFSLIEFPIIRNPDLLRDPGLYLSFIEPSVIGPWITGTESEFIRSRLIGLAVSVQYFATPLLKLEFSIADLGVQRWYASGTYNLPFLAPLYDLLGFDSVDFLEARDMIASYLANAGNANNPWATGFRDFLIDFSWLGSIAAMGATGFLLAHATALCRESNDMFDRAFGAVASMVAATLPFLSAFVVPQVLYPLLLLALLHVGRAALATRVIHAHDAVPLRLR